MFKKKNINKEFYFSIAVNQLFGYTLLPIEEFITRLQFKIQEKSKKLIQQGWTIKNVYFNKIKSLEDYEHEINLSFFVTRLETEQELQSRINKSKAAKLAHQKKKEKQEQAEKELYLKLKEKYETPIN